MDLVGRTAELSALRDALVAARAGRGGLVLLSGPAGMGKTALATTFAAEAARAGVAVLEGGGWESGGAGADLSWVAHLLPELGPHGPTAPGDSDGARFALVRGEQGPAARGRGCRAS